MKINTFLLAIFLIAIIPSVFAASVTLRPNSNATYFAWDNIRCDAASEWDCVDEIIVNTSDYLSSSSNNIKESFNFADSGLTGVQINSVTLHYYAKRASKPKNRIQPLIRANGTDYIGNNFSLTSSYVDYSQTYLTNPATGLAWTVADINALEAGMRTGLTNGGGNVAQIYAVVDYNPLADLVISNLTLSQSSAFQGDVVTVYVTTKNNGPGTAGASTTRVTDNTTNNDFSVGSLTSGSSQSNSFNYTCGTSNVTFTGTADIFGVVSETNEGNNQLANVLECKTQLLPDLIISNISVSKNITNGSLYAFVSIITKNIGNGVSNASTTRGIGLSIMDFSIGSLNPGASWSSNWAYNCSGSHYLNATADYFGVITESSETNNQLSTFIDCVL